MLVPVPAVGVGAVAAVMVKFPEFGVGAWMPLPLEAVARVPDVAGVGVCVVVLVGTIASG